MSASLLVFAQTTRQFMPRYNNPSEKGNIIFVANNIITSVGPSTSEVPPGGTSINDNSIGANIDIDNPANTVIFPMGSNWKYADSGYRPSTGGLSWEKSNFADGTWPSGNGQFGYGDAGMTTCLKYGCGGNVCNPSATCTKYMTYYFRKKFTIASLTNVTGFNFNYKRDDGIVVYVNGTEVFRNNMPGGTVFNSTAASSSISGGAETAINTYTFTGKSPFVVGTNTIAVEVHQDASSGTDLTFDLQLESFSNNGTWNSSSADLNLPSSCSQVLFAGLYWGASLVSQNNRAWRTAAKDTILLKFPGSSTYDTIVSTQTDIQNTGVPDATQTLDGYGAFADITSKINPLSPNGTYTAANVVGPAGLYNAGGGWSIVVVYQDPSDPVTRNLVVFDGSAVVGSSTWVEVPFGGFQTPLVGPVTCDLGVIAYDGDRGSPDGFFFKQDSAAAGVYSDMSVGTSALSTSTLGDSWNSTISYLNNVVTTRNPAHQNTLGYDADIVRLVNTGNTRLGNNKTSARIRMNSTFEKYFLQVVTSAISVAQPSFVLTESSTDLSGGVLAPTDSLRYTNTYSNRGSDTSVNTMIIDTIPMNAIYKRGTLTINGVPKTDAIGDDEAEFDSVANRVVFRIGTGANATKGGTVLPYPYAGNSGVVTFTVNAINICQVLLCNAVISNSSVIKYVGKTSGDSLINYSGVAAGSCVVTGFINNPIIGTCISLKDTLISNMCPVTSIKLPLTKYPNYTIYKALPITPSNILPSPSSPITATGTYYAFYVSPNGCRDTVILRVVITKCIDIDDDDDGIPDYVEFNNPLSLQDADGDGIPNWNDNTYPGYVDYNGDNVNDNFDWGADSDNDGIPNYYDRDFWVTFVDINGDGVNDKSDVDLDGIPNQYDRDSDNDGIPDVVESYGVDTNGDGVIDNFTDVDSDGFSGNVDGSPGTGVFNSGSGLGLPDLDGDGVPNCYDLDSDNDGIPDIVEVFGTDANNDGKVDNYSDTDADGFSDAVDGDVGNDGVCENSANALLRTGPDVAPVNGRADNYPYKNFDGDGRANCYDVDSDGDGIVDVIEAGFADLNFDGKIDSSFGADGWSDVIQAKPALNLVNTDGRGNPDYLDIDSDDDGITDLIEGQPTADPLPVQFAMPTYLDTDNDGLDNAFDNSPGFSGMGIAVYDKDGDGIPDYRDLDTDGDAVPDIIEGNDFNRNGLADDDVTLTLSDIDGDGLDDRFDSDNTTVKSTSSNVGTGGYDAGDPFPGTRSTVQKTSPTQVDRDWRFSGMYLAVPVRFLSLSADLSNDKVMLNWSVLSSKEIDHFELERSTDTTGSFSKWAIVNQKLVLNQPNKFVNADNITGISQSILYYRIKIIGKNGEISYSNVIAVRLKNLNLSALRITPNPASRYVCLKFMGEKNSEVKVRMFDNSGRMVLQQTETILEERGAVLVNGLERFERGMYTIQVSVNGQVLSDKVLLDNSK